MKTLNESRLDHLAEFIREYMSTNNGRAPVLKELVEETGMAKSTVCRYLQELNRRGVVHYSGRGTLEVDEARYKKSASIRVPILGAVICGSPEEEEERIEGYVAIPEKWVDGECFLLRAYGDSMIDIGVDEGDLVLVKKAYDAMDGQVVVALVDNRTTLKRLYWENGRPRLHAENSTYPKSRADMYPAELSIQGIALKVIKDIH